jgi:hypothetical protein
VLRGVVLNTAMQRNLMMALIAVVVVIAIGGAYLLVDQLVWRPEREAREFNVAFEKSMGEQCRASALAVAKQSGEQGPAVEERVNRRCACAVEVARPLPVPEKVALRTDREKLAKLAEEVIRRCGNG